MKKNVMTLGSWMAAAVIVFTAVAPVAGAEKQLAPRLKMGDVKVVPAGQAGYDRSPAIAFGGGRYLLVYMDGYNGIGGDSNIMGLILDARGEPVGKPVAICTAKGMQDSPAVGVCGDKFLVAWSDLRSEKDYDIYGVVVDASGAAGKEFIIAGGEKQAGGQAAPAIASNGKDTFLVVWQDHRGGKQFEVFGARVALDGKVTDPDGLKIMGEGANPGIAFNDGRYYVTIGTSGCTVDSDGKAGKPGVLWSEGKHSGGFSITTAYGKTLEILNGSPSPDPWGWSGNGCILGLTMMVDGSAPENKEAVHTWGAAAAARADRVTKNVIEAARWKNHSVWPQGMPGGFKGSHDGTWPSGQTAAAFNGRSLLVAWTTGNFIDILRLGNRDIYIKRVGDLWGSIDEVPMKILGGPTDEINPVLASDGAGGAVLSWERQNPAGGVLVEYAFISEDQDTQPPKLAYIQKMSDTKMIIGFDEPLNAASVGADSIAVEGATVKSVKFNDEGPSLRREVVVETDPLVVGKSCPVKVAGVADLAGNAAKGDVTPYVVRPGIAQRTMFISRWLTIAKWPTNYEQDYVKVATCKPTPGDVIKGRTDQELIDDMKKVITPERYEELTKEKLEEAVPKAFAGDKTWKVSACRWGDCLLDFIDAGYSKSLMAIGYAHTYVWSDVERDVMVRIDSQNGHRAWMNGKVISDDTQVPAFGSRALHDRTNECAAKLGKGWNQLMLCIDCSIFRWRVVTQITDLNRQPIRELTYQLESPAN
ncbi:MAG: hypothetical protein C0404_07395 [Verrucomicrobia bacterium]|nr:hypothetical protein [Verrucomicrobiota bacterium]